MCDEQVFDVNGMYTVNVIVNVIRIYYLVTN